MFVYFEHADGWSWETEATDLEEAQMIIENEAVATRENCAEDYVDSVFPMYWSIRSSGEGIVASGYVNERGETYS